MAQSVSDILILFFRFQLNIVLVALGVEVFGDWSVGSLMFPLLNVLEVVFFVEGGVGDESIFISEDNFLVVEVLSFESQILKFWLYWTILVHVGVNTSDPVLIRSVKIADSVPYFPLYFEIMPEIINNFIVFGDFNLIVVLVKFRVNILRRVVILVGQPGVLFILDFGVYL